MYLHEIVAYLKRGDKLTVAFYTFLCFVNIIIVAFVEI